MKIKQKLNFANKNVAFQHKSEFLKAGILIEQK